MKVRTGEKENTATLVKAVLFLAALVSLTIASLLYFRMRAVVAGDMEKQEYTHYIRHYAVIADNMEQRNGEKKQMCIWSGLEVV